MGDFRIPPDLLKTIQDLKTRVQALAHSQAPAVYTMATRPPASSATQGVTIFVRDATAGNKFQGWDGTSWVSLG